MKAIRTFLFLIAAAMSFTACEQAGYSMRGGQFSGAETFSVDYFSPRTPLATQEYAQQLTERFKDLMLAQSPLDFVESNGDLQYSGNIVGYTISYAGVQSDEQTSSNRLTVTVAIEYTNTKNTELSFDRKMFSASADYTSDQDIFAVQESLWEDINYQLSQNIYNATVGNW